MKTLILAAAVGMVAFAPSMIPGSTAQTAQAQSKPQQAMANCVKRIGAVSKTLRVSSKFVTRARATGICGQNKARPVLSSAIILRQYVSAAKIGAKTAAPKVMKACPGIVRKAIVASGANPKSASAENVKRACANAKGRPIIATAGFLGRMTAGVACMDKTMASLRALRISPKAANSKDVRVACGKAKNRPVFATRNFLTRITRGAK
ncbi:MAG: hypothetical protein ACI9JL_002558 [Paracoccaceae bacterium]|jgi:hypothetical protein